MKTTHILPPLSAAFATLLFSHAASPAAADPEAATVTAAPAKLVLKRGETGYIKLQLKISPRFHVNANPASSGLIPTTVQLSGPYNLAFGRIRYPMAHRRSFPYTELPIPVYSGTIEILVPVTASASTQSGVVKGAVRYQACDETSCYRPALAPFRVDVQVGPKR